MKPESSIFDSYLSELVRRRAYVKVQYFTELHELITLSAILVKLDTQDDDPVVALSSGEQIPLANLVSAGGQFSPNYEGYALYCETCDF